MHRDVRFEYFQCSLCGLRLPGSPNQQEMFRVCPCCGEECYPSSGPELAGADTKLMAGPEHGYGSRKWAVEDTIREEFCHDTGHRVGRRILIDRRTNLYFEKVVDKVTGHVIYVKSESLTKHVGHGYARRRTNQ